MADAEHKEMTVREFVEQCVLKYRAPIALHAITACPKTAPAADEMRTQSAMLVGYASALHDNDLKPVLSNRQGPFEARIEYITGPEMMRRAAESLNESANIIELLLQYAGIEGFYR